jgi:hypothetical protein
MRQQVNLFKLAIVSKRVCKVRKVRHAETRLGRYVVDRIYDPICAFEPALRRFSLFPQADFRIDPRPRGEIQIMISGLTDLSGLPRPGSDLFQVFPSRFDLWCAHILHGSCSVPVEGREGCHVKLTNLEMSVPAHRISLKPSHSRRSRADAQRHCDRRQNQPRLVSSRTRHRTSCRLLTHLLKSIRAHHDPTPPQPTMTT